jgi:hypothetical protein
MKRRGWLIFLAVQALGEVCAWSWPHILSAVGPWVWGGAFFLLLPGNLLSVAVIQKLLWGGSLTLFQLSLLEVPVEIAINAAVWLLFAKLYRLLRGRRSALASAPTSGSNLSHRSP